VDYTNAEGKKEKKRKTEKRKTKKKRETRQHSQPLGVWHARWAAVRAPKWTKKLNVW
jgi:hypothetical protein